MEGNNIIQGITFFSSLLAGSGIIIFLGKLIIEKTFDLGVEKFRSNMQKEMELHRFELEKRNFEFQTKFSSLHLERLEAIKNLFLRLQEFKSCLSGLLIHINMIPAPKLNDERSNELITNLWDSYLKLTDFFSSNKIYFSKELNQKILKLEDLFMEENLQRINVQTWESNRALRNSTDFDKFLESEYERLIVIHKQDINSVLLELEDQFREMLGVN